MRQVGADHDQGFGAAPHLLDDLRDFRRRGVADGQRQQRERFEHRLQERKLHFERMLERVSGFAIAHLRQRADARRGLGVDRDRAERRGKRLDSGQREPTDWHAVHGTEQDDAPDARAGIPEPGVGSGGDRPGIDIAGMGNDQRLGP